MAKRISARGEAKAAPKAAAPKKAAAAKKAAAPKKAAPKAALKEAAAAPAAPAAASGDAGVHIVGSKVCQAFKKSADLVTAAVLARAPGTKVTVELLAAEGRKPDRGSFVVTANGVNVVELRTMPRPFTAMKALDIQSVAADVAKALA